MLWVKGRVLFILSSILLLDWQTSARGKNDIHDLSFHSLQEMTLRSAHTNIGCEVRFKGSTH